MNPEIGRFVSTDPFGGIQNDPVSLHKYLYASANPVMFIDPSGEFTLMQTMTVLGISAGIVSALNQWSDYFQYENFGYYKFALTFKGGSSAGAAFYLGSIYAVINAYDKDKWGVAEQAVYRIFMFGMGVGFSFNLMSESIHFETPVRTSLYQFEGWGSTTSISATGGVLAIGLTAISLPNGYKIHTWKPNLNYEVGVGLTAYSVLTYWDYICDDVDCMR